MTLTSPLYERLVEVLGTRDVHPDVRSKIQDAYIEVGDTGTWDDLPVDVRQMIEESERLPRQAWDDPADVPQDLDKL